MTDVYRLVRGRENKTTCPILVSMPHNGTAIPSDIAHTMEDKALKVEDTDWYLDKLYDFVLAQGASMIVPKYSRYVIDLNRPENDENLYPGSNTTSLCPVDQFDLSPIYKKGLQPNSAEIKRRVELYWQPYHLALRQELNRIKKQFGFALLFEAHSIKSVVPRFFEGSLPDFNFGNNNGLSCGNNLINLISNWHPKGYSSVVNGRFKGGYITRAYGDPSNQVESIQLELSQATYLNEKTLSFEQAKVNKVLVVLQEMFQLLIDYSQTKISEFNEAS